MDGRAGRSKLQIKEIITKAYEYDIKRRLDDYSCDLSCQHTVPEAIICFLESEDFEDAIRNAVSLGGDADTMACICGSLAEAFYGGIPHTIAPRAEQFLDQRILKRLKIIAHRYGYCSYLKST